MLEKKEKQNKTEKPLEPGRACKNHMHVCVCVCYLIASVYKLRATNSGHMQKTKKKKKGEMGG